MSKAREQQDTSNTLVRTSLVELPASKIQKIKSIGVGGFAEVFYGKWEGTEVAVKQLFLKTMNRDLYDDFLNEAEIMAKCRHPSVIHFYGISTQEGIYQLILEYLPRGNLYDSLSNSKVEMPIPLCKNISLDIARGLNYLHSLHIIHRDLKSLNILLSNDWKAKISDFGLAKIKLATEMSSTVSQKATSVRWCSPELFKRNAMRTKFSDVWSYGMVLWEIFSRKIPYAEETNEQIVINFIREGERETISDDWPSVVCQVIKKCWMENPKDRIEASQIVDLLESDANQIDPVSSAMTSLSLAPGSVNTKDEVKVSPTPKVEANLPFAPPISDLRKNLQIFRFIAHPKDTNSSLSDDFTTLSTNGVTPIYITDIKVNEGTVCYWEVFLKECPAARIGIIDAAKDLPLFRILGGGDESWSIGTFKEKMHRGSHEKTQAFFEKGNVMGLLVDMKKRVLSVYKDEEYKGIFFTIPQSVKTVIPAVDPTNGCVLTLLGYKFLS